MVRGSSTPSSCLTSTILVPVSGGHVSQVAHDPRRQIIVYLRCSDDSIPFCPGLVSERHVTQSWSVRCEGDLH